MSDLENYIYKRYKENPKLEVFKIKFEGVSYWVKKGTKSGSNLLHKIAYKFFKLPVLTPTANKSAIETIRFETAKLKKLKKLQQNVPEVILDNSDFFVLNDKGRGLFDIIKHKEFDDIEKLLYDVLKQLSILHNHNQYHGGSQIKNFTLYEGNVYILDFEESFDKSIDIKTLQFRDLFLFLFSLSKLSLDLNYQELVKYYISQTKNDDFEQKLKDLCDTLLPLTKFIKFKPIWKLIGKDAKGVYNLINTISNPNFKPKL